MKHFRPDQHIVTRLRKQENLLSIHLGLICIADAVCGSAIAFDPGASTGLLTSFSVPVEPQTGSQSGSTVFAGTSRKPA